MTPLIAVGGSWCAFGSSVSQSHQASATAAQQLLGRNQSEALTAFRTSLEHPESPLSVLGDASTGVQVVGAAIYAAAGLVIGLVLAVAATRVLSTLLHGVRPLDAAERREEIARMLSGAEVTDEARAQAGRLLEAA